MQTTLGSACMAVLGAATSERLPSCIGELLVRLLVARPVHHCCVCSYIVECVTEIQKGPAALPALSVLRRIATVHDSSVGAKVRVQRGRCF